MPKDQGKSSSSTRSKLHLVSHVEQVVDNIVRLNAHLARNPNPLDLDMHPRKALWWYAVSTRTGWQFGPSRYVGYAGMTPELHLHYNEHFPRAVKSDWRNGRLTQSALKPLSRAVDLRSPLYKKLKMELSLFLRRMEPPMEASERAGIRILRTVLYDEEAREHVNTSLVHEFRKKVRSLSKSTEIVREVKQRAGQKDFREALLEDWNRKCPLTGIADERLLRASHIRPWSKCRSDKQRLDLDNGLLLSALWDAAFDAGLVTFKDDGKPIFSPVLGDTSRSRLNFRGPFRLNKKRKEYMRYHRQHVFRKSG